jgi:hypothetical protein
MGLRKILYYLKIINVTTDIRISLTRNKVRGPTNSANPYSSEHLRGQFQLHTKDCVFMTKTNPLMANRGIVCVRFEVFTAVAIKNGVFWDITPCGSCKNRRFGGT